MHVPLTELGTHRAHSQTTAPARAVGGGIVGESIGDMPEVGALDQESDNLCALPTFEEAFLDRGAEDPDDRFSTGD